MFETVLELKDISNSYRFLWEKTKVLKDINIALEKGHIYGLVGNNGAGKTTLMRVIGGLVRPDTGSVSLFSSKNDKELSAARKRLGILIETPACFDELTIMQNLKSQAMLLPKGGDIDLDELCRSVGIDEEFAKKRIKNCSLGQKQRYGLASALIGEPELLLLDEPLNGLDPEGINDFRALLLQLNREKNMTMLISSHILAELNKTATDYIFLMDGQVQECITASRLEEKIAEAGLLDVEEYFLKLTGRKE